jgi:hypothetical protein
MACSSTNLRSPAPLRRACPTAFVGHPLVRYELIRAPGRWPETDSELAQDPRPLPSHRWGSRSSSLGQAARVHDAALVLTPQASGEPSPQDAWSLVCPAGPDAALRPTLGGSCAGSQWKAGARLFLENRLEAHRCRRAHRAETAESLHWHPSFALPAELQSQRSPPSHRSVPFRVVASVPPLSPCSQLLRWPQPRPSTLFRRLVDPALPVGIGLVTHPWRQAGLELAVHPPATRSPLGWAMPRLAWSPPYRLSYPSLPFHRSPRSSRSRLMDLFLPSSLSAPALPSVLLVYWVTPWRPLARSLGSLLHAPDCQ